MCVICCKGGICREAGFIHEIIGFKDSRCVSVKKISKIESCLNENYWISKIEGEVKLCEVK